MDMKKISAKDKKRNPDELFADYEYIPVSWRREPVEYSPAVKKTDKELFEDINSYFRDIYDRGENPRITDLVGSIGFESLNQMVNHARRRGGQYMANLSRSLLAVAAGYEDQVQEGHRHALAMLGLIPQFDSEEPAEQMPAYTFQPTHKHELDISGLKRIIDKGKEMQPQESYLKLIKNKSYEQIKGTVEKGKKSTKGAIEIIPYRTSRADLLHTHGDIVEDIEEAK